MESELKMLPVADVIPTPDNPRRMVKNDPLVAELAESIRSSGMLQPVVCRPHPKLQGKYDLRAGARRHMAHLAIGADQIMAIVRDMDDKTAMEVTVLENMRANLTPMEEARGVQALLDTGHDIEQIANDLGKPRNWIYRRAKLVRLIPELVEAIEDAESPWHSASAAHLELVARLPEERQKKIFSGSRWIITKPVAEVAKMLAQDEHKMSSVKWDMDDMTLGPLACSACLNRSDVQPDLFFDNPDPALIKKNAQCLDPECWRRKADAYMVREAGTLRQEHGDKAVLITSYDSPVKGTHETWDVERCKKTTPGARPALIEQDGKIERTWVKVRAGHEDRIGTESKPRMPSLDLRRKAWVIQYVEKTLTDKKTKCPIASVQYIAALAAVVGTWEHKRWCGKNSAWDDISKLAGGESATVVEKLWENVLPVLVARLRYQTISDCANQYTEAVHQARLLDMGNEKDLLKLAEAALSGKVAKKSKK